MVGLTRSSNSIFERWASAEQSLAKMLKMDSYIYSHIEKPKFVVRPITFPLSIQAIMSTTSNALLPLSGKLAIVTGSSRGIGEAIALDLANRGAKVMITYTSASSEDKVQKLIARIASLNNGSSAASVKADLSLPDSPQQIVDATLSAFSTNTIDILINNAAVFQERLMKDVSPEEFDAQHLLNLRAPFFLTQCVRKHLPSAGGGRIINISSVGSRLGLPGFSVYGSAKAGLEALTRSFASEFGPAGHTVNAVNPGTTQSDMMDQLSDTLLQKLKSSTPMQNRLATGEDVAFVVGWLASEESRWITGQSISASGGLAMY